MPFREFDGNPHELIIHRLTRNSIHSMASAADSGLAAFLTTVKTKNFWSTCAEIPNSSDSIRSSARSRSVRRYRSRPLHKQGRSCRRKT